MNASRSTLDRIIALAREIGDDNRNATSILYHLAACVCDGSERELAELVNDHYMRRAQMEGRYKIEDQRIGSDKRETS